MELENIIKIIFLQHVGRENAITIKQLCKSPFLKGASEKMIRTGIYNLRKQCKVYNKNVGKIQIQKLKSIKDLQ